MAHDVFISHSTQDKTAADATCAWLERQGIRCWIAPRDIRPGAEWAPSILNGIRDSRVMVVIFSRHANSSRMVRHEVESAVRAGLTILPIRIEDVMPEGDLELYIGASHWLDAFHPPFEQHLNVLAATIDDVLEQAPARTSTAPPKAPAPAANASPSTSGYDVFVSAKSEDYPHATIAAKYLQDAGLRVFFSLHELPNMGNSDYFSAIDDALEYSHHMLVITSSREYVSSRWVKKEWQTFLNEKLSGRKSGNLVTLLCDKMSIADLPLSLRQHEARANNDLVSLLKYFKPAPVR